MLIIAFAELLVLYWLSVLVIKQFIIIIGILSVRILKDP